MKEIPHHHPKYETDTPLATFSFKISFEDFKVLDAIF